MLIGIDGNEANIKNRVGVNVYAHELLRNLHNLKSIWSEKHEFVVYLKDLPLPDMPKETTGWRYEILPSGPMWILTRLTPHLFIAKKRPAVLFSPSHYVPLVSPVPRICSIMDLGYLNNSEQFGKSTYWQLKYWTAKSISISKHIIAISNATKDDIVRHYPSASTKITVTHLGYNKQLFNTSVSPSDVRRTVRKYGIAGDYILFLSTLKPSKNIERLVEAFDLLKSETTLVIAGKKGWMYEAIYEKVKKYGLENKVLFTGFIPERDKAALLTGATLFAAPSLWEGFGLHVLEAMACGTPVVVSNRGSLPEVVGKAGIVVDPENVADMARGLSAVLKLGKYRYEELQAKCIRQAQKFDWKATATKTLKVIEDTVK